MILRKAEGIEVEGPETCLPYSGQQESIHFSLTVLRPARVYSFLIDCCFAVYFLLLSFLQDWFALPLFLFSSRREISVSVL